MNPLLSRLQPYPFERLRQLFVGVKPNPAYRPISLGIGEPKHPTPEFIKQALVGSLDGLATYPATAGEPHLREAFRHWLAGRYGLMAVDADTQMLPVNGSREALFAFAQTVIDPGKKPIVVSAPTRSTKSTKARRCWPAPSPTTRPAIPRATSPWTGTACRSRSGPARSCCSSARRATPPAP